MVEIYHEEMLDTSINIHPRDLNNNIDKILEDNLIDKVEGICLKEGYIQPGSTKIVSKSSGNMNVSDFNGYTTYNIKYKANVCNLKEGDIINCYVNDNNKSAVYAYYENKELSPLKIFIAKQYHIGNTDFIKLKEGDYIEVEVVKTKYSYLDSEILVLSRFIKKIN